MSETSPATAAEWAEHAHNLRRSGKQAEALVSAAQALKLDPALSAMWDCIGFLLLERGRWDEARHYLLQAVNLAPAQCAYRCHLAIALMELDAFDAAQEQLEAALRLEFENAEAHYFMAELLCRTGHYDHALSYYEVARASGNLKQAATFGEGTALFLTGSYDVGLKYLAEARPTKKNLPLPEWKGEVDPNLHLVLSGEHGFGGIIHFARYAREAKKCVRQVTLSLPWHLVRLFRANFPEFPVHAYQVPDGAVLSDNISRELPKDADAQCFYLDLPSALQPFDPHTDDVPYIHASPVGMGDWAKRFESIKTPRIGLVWSGNPRHQNDHNRSIPFDALKPLLNAAPGHFISLQRGDKTVDAMTSGLFDVTPFIGDFADSACAVASLDLLITIDSAPAHLAGAMGKPVWTLLPFNPDWRWLLGREDSIWYPTMKLYRQSAPKDWTSVVEALRIDIEKLYAGDASVLRPTPWHGGALKRHPNAVPLAGLEHGDAA